MIYFWIYIILSSINWFFWLGKSFDKDFHRDGLGWLSLFLFLPFVNIILFLIFIFLLPFNLKELYFLLQKEKKI